LVPINMTYLVKNYDLLSKKLSLKGSPIFINEDLILQDRAIGTKKILFEIETKSITINNNLWHFKYTKSVEDENIFLLEFPMYTHNLSNFLSHQNFTSLGILLLMFFKHPNNILKKSKYSLNFVKCDRFFLLLKMDIKIFFVINIF